ncbi:MAG: outer membrane lipid asymmetry maintenance protein MlaD [Rhizomicrobium sp.]|jgi:phospholipid/cholesterol/gamma-HCH transport system substrate-binding protein
MHNNTVETLIGAAVVAVAVFFLVFAYRSTGSTAAAGYELTAKMARVDGIAIGTDVRLSGIKVGEVSALTLDPKDYLVIVHMNIHSDVKVPDDSSLVVTMSGLLGSSYLSISPGGSDKMLAVGGVIRNTQGSIDLMGLLSRFAGSAAGGNGNSDGTKP